MSLRHAVLGLLAQQPGSGYDLLKRFEERFVYVWPATQSQLYGELGKMEKAGLVRVAAEGPRGRKEYEITPEGHADLRHWLIEVVPDGTKRDDRLLRVFFLSVLSPEEARTYLQQNLAVFEERLEALREIERVTEWGPNLGAKYGRISLEFGLRQLTMLRDWAEWSLKQFD
ncbi:DNA-binding transcriptional regulator, PadR family [Amycolatopsis xylanica]|uniref:DNA-binding transcriptional regulator, PadR family n=1 Tax=Amycolatopsis xylanica TaxID=589385 RepID=A0A1H3G6W2_9PSEU|nr:PadR family transcriptional regulator [Amycolatopsis xylanica]SDX98109.1 DNA-binding transcriptional regulator, PadR family [Amycolatopsis xylanica]